jgi:hypothetical protein
MAGCEIITPEELSGSYSRIGKENASLVWTLSVIIHHYPTRSSAQGSHQSALPKLHVNFPSSHSFDPEILPWGVWRTVLHESLLR